MLPLGRPDSAVDFASRLPAKKASQYPINKPNNPIIINDTARRCEVTVHRTPVRAVIDVCEESFSL
jgi:hypothetical protein